MKRAFFVFFVLGFYGFGEAKEVKPVSDDIPKVLSKGKTPPSASSQEPPVSIQRKVKNQARKVVIVRDLSSLDEVVKSSQQQKQKLQKDIQLYLKDKNPVGDIQERQPASAVDFEEEYEIRWDREP